MPRAGTVLIYLLDKVRGYQVVERGTGDQAGPHNQDELPTAPGDQAIAVVSVPIKHNTHFSQARRHYSRLLLRMIPYGMYYYYACAFLLLSRQLVGS